MSNDFLVKVESLKEEIDKLEKQYNLIQGLKEENTIEQAKIVEQNLTIKRQIDYLQTTQTAVDSKEVELNEREKQIIIKEKSIITSNRLLDEKLNEFRQKTIDLDLQVKRFDKDKNEYAAKKAVVDRQAKLYQKLEQTEDSRRKRMKVREEEIDAELQRLRGM